MTPMRLFLLLTALILTGTASVQGTESAAAASAAPRSPRSPRLPAPRIVDLKASDGTLLKASYFAAAKPGPGVLLLHQVNRTRKAWDELYGRRAAAGVHTLSPHTRAQGESGGTPHDRL